MWIVRIALDRPYTVIVLALLILIVSPVVIARTPTDIFPSINIPVIAVACLRVAVVRNGRAELVPVKLGRDYGRSVEVVSGLSPTDAVIVDPADSLVSGTAVRVIERPTEKKKP